MNDGIRSLVTRTPLARPTSAPIPMPTAAPIQGEPVALMTVAATQALSPTVAPIDKSILAVRITSVRPDAMKNSRLAWRRTFSRLFVVRKASLANDRTTQMMNTASSR